jgi:hypothetical protein
MQWDLEGWGGEVGAERGGEGKDIDTNKIYI